MKNLPYLINFVLLAAIGFLYYLHFSTTQNPVSMELPLQQEGEAPSNILSGTGIYYVNTDSLWVNYELVKDAQDNLKIEKLKLESQFKTKLSAFEKEYIDLQNKAGKGLITMEEAQRKEGELMEKQQKLLELKDELALKFMEMEQEMNEKIQIAIYEYLNKFRMQNDINFVLGYNRGGGAVLIGNDSLEITNSIVSGLNTDYKAQQLTEKVKK
ncbi:MAG: OmpH family outer membrane protein [Bacteroidetes bacterium]|nr:OmpH family outer membrane protein [Bacteroidota bacterium]HET6243347.1 OmpH family outer membrane protein [Bacteroidia bacterium]